MFGKPGWFRERTMRIALMPATWQGWLYAGAWGAAVTIPAIALLGENLLPETLVWLTASLGALGLDVRQMRRAASRWEKDEVLVIRE